MKKPLLPPVYALLSLVLMGVFHFLVPVKRILPFPWNLLGVLVIGVGVALNLTAVATFKRAGTTEKPFQTSTALVTDGVYRLTRNPMYLGITLGLVGVAMLFGSLTPYIGAVDFVVITEILFIPTEEKMLDATFGEAYRNYKARVRRWI